MLCYISLNDPLATDGTYAEGINDLGQVVGYYFDNSGLHGFLYSGGSYTTINDPLATQGTVATGINNKGEIVGDYFDGSGEHGFAIIPNPTEEPDRAHVQEGHSIRADAAHGVLANDTDPIPNDMLIVSAVDGLASDVGHAIVGSYGTLTLNADGSYSYVADQSVPSNIIAQDIFTYTASEGAGGSATSSLTITITQAGQTYIAGTPGQPLSYGNGSVFLDGSLLQNQTITAGNGVDAVIAGSNDTIVLGNGNDVVNAGANSNITAGNGNDNVTAGSDSTIKLGNGNDTVTAGANSTIKLGNGAGDSVSATFSSNDTITLGNGAGDSVSADSGSYDTITLGNGAGDSVSADSSNDTITLGKGAGRPVSLQF